jgi:hypothetical protein
VIRVRKVKRTFTDFLRTFTDFLRSKHNTNIVRNSFSLISTQNKQPWIFIYLIKSPNWCIFWTTIISAWPGSQVCPPHNSCVCHIAADCSNFLLGRLPMAYRSYHTSLESATWPMSWYGSGRHTNQSAYVFP